MKRSQLNSNKDNAQINANCILHYILFQTILVFVNCVCVYLYFFSALAHRILMHNIPWHWRLNCAVDWGIRGTFEKDGWPTYHHHHRHLRQCYHHHRNQRPRHHNHHQCSEESEARLKTAVGQFNSTAHGFRNSLSTAFTWNYISYHCIMYTTVLELKSSTMMLWKKEEN